MCLWVVVAVSLSLSLRLPLCLSSLMLCLFFSAFHSSSISAVSHCVSPCYDYITLSVCCVHLDLKLIISDNLVVLFPKFTRFSGERAMERGRESCRNRQRDGAHQACWRYLPFVEYSILIAYRFLISESFRVNRTHYFHSYCSLGFVNCHPTGRIKSKLKALTIDSIWSHSPQQFHKTMGRINENAAWFLFSKAFAMGNQLTTLQDDFHF